MSGLIGLGLAGLIALVAHRMGLLTRGGALAATVVGASVFGIGGLTASIPLLAFFFSGSLLPRALGRPQATERRSAMQVLANGLAPTLCCWGVALFPEQAHAFWLGYAGSLATAAADTWATEFGLRFGNPVWLITTGRRIPPGESGGVSLQGTALGAVGALLIAALCLPMLNQPTQVATAAALGFVGMVLDSLLGATLQARYHCPHCNAVGERAFCCGVPASRRRGLRWVDNNTVNLLSTLAAAILGCSLA